MNKISRSKKNSVKNNALLDRISDLYPDALKMDGYDDCIIGICHVFAKDGQKSIIAYSKEKVIARLMVDGMSYEEALEFHDFNQSGAYVGENTPCFIEENP